MSISTCRIAVQIFTSLALLVDFAGAQTPTPLHHIYKEIGESEPRVVNGLEVTIAVQSQWYFLGSKDWASIDLALRLTNRTASPLVVPLFDTFSLHVTDADGKDLLYSGGRDGTSFVAPVLLRPGQTFSVVRETTLKKGEKKEEAPTLEYRDGTGSWAFFRLKGKQPFKLYFDLANSGFGKSEEFVFDRLYSKDEVAELKGRAVWRGKGSTGAVAAELLSPAGQKELPEAAPAEFWSPFK